jgi:predicted N-acetyltransferase YhbS
VTAAHIRPADITDADAVFALLSEFVVSYTPDRQAFDHNFEMLLGKMTFDSTDMLVAEDGDAIVGYALMTRTRVLYANGQLAQLQELMVTASHRGKGIGGQLVEAVIARAEAAGAVEITVPTSRAPDFYPRFGFRRTAHYLKKRLTGSRE